MMNLSPHLSAPGSTLDPENFDNSQKDGAIDVMSRNMPKRRRLAGDVCAIFVHAGAGFHSLQNERVHLSACEE